MIISRFHGHLGLARHALLVRHKLGGVDKLVDA